MLVFDDSACAGRKVGCVIDSGCIHLGARTDGGASYSTRLVTPHKDNVAGHADTLVTSYITHRQNTLVHTSTCEPSTPYFHMEP